MVNKAMQQLFFPAIQLCTGVYRNYTPENFIMKNPLAIRHFVSTCNWMRNDNTIHDINEKARLQRFWLVSFAVYAMAEALFWLINYLITRQHCIPCLQPPVYFIMQWLLTIISTALLWYALNAFYFAGRWSL